MSKLITKRWAPANDSYRDHYDALADEKNIENGKVVWMFHGFRDMADVPDKDLPDAYKEATHLYLFIGNGMFFEVWNVEDWDKFKHFVSTLRPNYTFKDSDWLPIKVK